MTITLNMLKEKNACYWDRRELTETAKRVEANLPSTLHEIMCWDWVPLSDREWVFQKFAMAPRREAYEKAMAPHWEAYEKASAEHWEACEKAMAEHWKACEKAMAPRREAYEKAMAPHWKAYEKAMAPHLKACEKARSLELQEATR